MKAHISPSVMRRVSPFLPSFRRAGAQPAVRAQHQVKLWYENHVAGHAQTLLFERGQDRQHRKEVLGV